MHCSRRAASRAACTAGSSSAIRIADDRDHHQEFHQVNPRLILATGFRMASPFRYPIRDLSALFAE